jgi:hypothetical protein
MAEIYKVERQLVIFEETIIGTRLGGLPKKRMGILIE